MKLCSSFYLSVDKIPVLKEQNIIFSLNADHNKERNISKKVAENKPLSL